VTVRSANSGWSLNNCIISIYDELSRLRRLNRARDGPLSCGRRRRPNSSSVPLAECPPYGRHTLCQKTPTMAHGVWPCNMRQGVGARSLGPTRGRLAPRRPSASAARRWALAWGRGAGLAGPHDGRPTRVEYFTSSAPGATVLPGPHPPRLGSLSHGSNRVFLPHPRRRLSVARDLPSRPGAASPPRGALEADDLAISRLLFSGLGGLRAPVTTRVRPRPPHHAMTAIARVTEWPAACRRLPLRTMKAGGPRSGGNRFTTQRRWAYVGRRTIRDSRSGERRSG
jgi:hypothetical protein